MGKYTPGPWIVEKNSMGTILIGAPARTGRQVIATPHSKSVHLWADSNLIASAPELLETLKLVMVSFEVHGSADPEAPKLIEQIKSVILKAEGK